MSESDWRTITLVIVIAKLVSGRIAPGNAANGPEVGPAPFKFSGTLELAPNV